MKNRTDQEKRTELDKVGELFRILEEELLPQIEAKDQQRINARNILFNEKPEELDPRLKAIRIISEERSKSTHPGMFIWRLRQRVNEIRSYEPEIVALVEDLAKSSDEEIRLLRDLLSNIQGDEGKATAYLKRGYHDYIKKFEGYHDSKTILELKRIMFEISGEELYYLRIYEKDARSWPLLSGKNGANVFAQRIMFYINGGGHYKGLLPYFKDNKTVRRIYRTNVLKQLINYAEEKLFFDKRFEEIDAGLKEGDWRDFYEFWGDIRRNIRRVRERFGNEEFAIIMEKDAKKFRESPLEWRKAVGRMVQTLHDRRYEVEKVIKPASEELQKIFGERIKELEQKSGRAVSELRTFLQKEIADFETMPEKRIERLMAAVWKKNRAIMREWKKIRDEFERKELMVLIKMNKFITTMEFLEKRGLFEQMENARRVTEIKSRWMHYLEQLTSRLTGDVRDFNYLSRAWAVPYALEDIAERLEESGEIMTDILINDAPKRLGKQLKLGKEIIERLDELLSYVSSITPVGERLVKMPQQRVAEEVM